jgi:Gluconate 2-dehydrogenase subunit 3
MAIVLANHIERIAGAVARSLGRDDHGPRHHFEAGDPPRHAAELAEAWRFPLLGGAAPAGHEAVAFVHRAAAAQAVALLGEPVDGGDVHGLTAMPETGCWALTLALPLGRRYRYRYLVDGRQELDAINPQREASDDGATWSRVFTSGCTVPLSLEAWEWTLLDRLAGTLVSGMSDEAADFLDQRYRDLDRVARDAAWRVAYRFDNAFGAVNFIDKILAREEAHRRRDYRICLLQLNRIARQRHPWREPAAMPASIFEDLLRQLAASSAADESPIPGWDYGRYGSPRFFLRLLLRHVLTGIFAHPRHGGNPAGIAWDWLADRCRDSAGAEVFAWRNSLPPPLGNVADYRE